MSIKFTRKTDYALVALAALVHPNPSAADARSAREIAQQYGLPVPLLANLLKRMHEVGLIHSRRGIGGGYWLAKPASRITVADVIAAIEGPLKLTPCCDESDQPACQSCAVQPNCPVTDSIRKLSQAMVKLLRNVTIEDLCTQKLNLDLLHEAAPPTENFGPSAALKARQQMVQLAREGRKP